VAIGQVQPDLWIGLCLLLAWYFLREERWWAGGLALAAGASIKPIPLIVLPFLALYLIRRGAAKGCVLVTMAVVGGIVLSWLPYLVAFPDGRAFGDAIRFQLARPPAGLTIPFGLAALANAVSAGRVFLGHPAPSGLFGAEFAQRVDAAYPLLTVGALVTAMIVAGKHRWPLPRVFLVPLLLFLLTNKVIHEHYLLQVIPLFLLLGVELRGLISAYAIYLLAAGTPLRFFPRQWGVPATLDAVVPPSMQASLGVVVTIGLMATVGLAALAFGVQIVRLLRRELLRAAEPSM